jgi:four helix bundle protein
MVAKDFTELIAWQRADALEQFALRMLKHPGLARDDEFCQQTSDAAGSAPRNIAEGHGRFAPPQFANFVRIAIGSEMETRNQIIKAWQRGALTDAQKHDGLVLCKRALAAAVRLRLYLDSEEARANAKRIESDQKKRTK